MPLAAGTSDIAGHQPFSDAAVRAVFDRYPHPLRCALLSLRQIIFETACATQVPGGIIETLKWGQPAYLPARPRVGTTVRIDRVKDSDHAYAAYFHCQTQLIAIFGSVYPGTFLFQGRRAILLSTREPMPQDELKHCLAMALTYHVMRNLS